MNPSTGVRIAVERVLRESSCPLNAEEIARLAAHPLNLVRNQLSLGIKYRKLQNVGGSRALYVWGGKDEPEAVQYESRIPTATYTGEKPLPERPGSMKAYTLPSLENGNRVDRKKPILIGAPPEKRV